MVYLFWGVLVLPDEIRISIVIILFVAAGVYAFQTYTKRKTPAQEVKQPYNPGSQLKKTECPYCGEEIYAGARKCRHCGEWIREEDMQFTDTNAEMGEASSNHFSQGGGATNQPVIIQQTSLAGTGSNGSGVAGFIFAVLGLFLGWVPVLGTILWILGALFSLAGLFKRPRGFAIVGLILSFIDIIIILSIAGTIASFF